MSVPVQFDGPSARGEELGELASQWRTWRQLYPFYLELARRFELGGPCCELECPVDSSDAGLVAAVRQWFDAMDERTDAHHLRILVQTTRLGTEASLRALLQHHLGKGEKAASDRDKVDFLLVHYFASCAPHSLTCGNFELEDVAFVLEPVLGEAVTLRPAWLEPLEKALAELRQCRSLGDLLGRRVLDRVRELKNSSGQMYFGTAAMLGFTRFNFHVRRAFFHLMRADLEAVRAGLSELEARGVHAIDCRRARLSAQEPLGNLRQICDDWKQVFRAPYSAGHSFEKLVGVRAAIEQALAFAGEREAGDSAIGVADGPPAGQQSDASVIAGDLAPALSCTGRAQ